MNISGSNSYTGLYDYNSIKGNRLQTDATTADVQKVGQSVSSEKIPTNPQDVGTQQPVPAKKLQTDAEEVRAKQKYTSADYAQQYQKGVE